MSLYEYWLLSLPFIGAMTGVMFARFFPFKENIGLKLILSFSGAFLLGITIFELLPKIFSEANKQMSVYVMGGILFQILLEYLSKGAEHGHYHLSGLNIFPITMWLSLCLHAILEGMPLSNQIELTYGIIIHKIPIGMVLYLMMEKTKINVKIKWSALLLFSLMTPLGNLIMTHAPYLNVNQPEITGWVVGMILHVSTTILFESASNHSFNFRKLCVIFLGILLSYII
jgi:zinc transporter ZupT